MSLKIKEAADAAGISVRTLHHYDQIGLLKPDALTDAGYRLYSVDNLEKLQQIMFFRELDFGLIDIQDILDNPEIDRISVLEKQKQLLGEKKERLESIINLVEKTITLNKRGHRMSDKELFESFDMKDIEKHKKDFAEEAKKQYGGTDAYKESMRKTSGYSKKDWKMITEEAKQIYEAFASLMNKDESDSEVVEIVLQWQEHITKHYYECTDEILKGLGELYSSDERFKKNIDKTKPGLANYMSKAISAYCRRKK